MTEEDTGKKDEKSAGSDDEKPQKHKRLRHYLIWGGLAVVVIVGLIFGVPYLLHMLSHESTDDAFIEGHIIPISFRVPGTVAEIYVHENEWVEAGDVLVELDARPYEARVAAARGALDSARAVQNKNRINVDLTTTNAESDVSQAEANVRSAAANVDSARAQATARQSDLTKTRQTLAAMRAALEQAQADVDVANAQHEKDLVDLERYRGLVKAGAATEQDLDHAATAERVSAAQLEAAKRSVQTHQAQVDEAQAEVQAAEDTLKQAQADVATREAALDLARAQLVAAQAAPQRIDYSRSEFEQSKADTVRAAAELEQAKLDLEYTRVYAPCSGHVTKKTVEPGEYVAVGQTLMAIVPPTVWVKANFKETQLTRMQPGQPAAIHVDTYPGVTFHGYVQSIQRGTGSRFSLLPPENATGNYIKVVQRVPVRIEFNDHEQLHKYLLAPGMSVVPDVNIKASGEPRRTETTSQNRPPSGAAPNTDPPAP